MDQIKSTERKHKERHKRLTEQFTNGVRDLETIAKIMKDLTPIKHASEITSKEAMSCVKCTKIP